MVVPGGHTGQSSAPRGQKPVWATVSEEGIGGPGGSQDGTARAAGSLVPRVGSQLGPQGSLQGPVPLPTRSQHLSIPTLAPEVQPCWMNLGSGPHPREEGAQMPPQTVGIQRSWQEGPGSSSRVWGATSCDTGHTAASW